MRYRWLAVFPILYALVFVAVAVLLGDSQTQSTFVRWQLILLRVLALIGCIAAVRAFQAGDHLRRAWLALAVTTALVLVRDLLRLLVAAPSGSAGFEILISALGVTSNLFLLAGVWLLARSWRKASMELPGGRGGVVAAVLVAAALAFAVAGPGAWHHFQSVMEGDGSAVVLLASAVVDILSLCLLAPLFLTALALRGGLFAWPWALVTASIFCWLLYDASYTLAPVLQLEGFPLNDVFRGMALNYLAVAGLAQRFAVSSVRAASR